MSESNVPLLESKPQLIEEDDANGSSLSTRIWVESKQLWHIVGPAIFSRVASYSMLVITQAFAGHLGDLELAAMSIANNVIVGFDFGLLLGMASALETLCGQAYGAKKFHMLGIYMQRSWIVLFICCILTLPIYLFSTPFLKLLGQPSDLAEMAGKVAVMFLPLHFSFAIQFPLQRFLQSQLKTAVIAYVSLVALVVHILVSWLFVYGLELGLVGTAITTNISWWVLVLGLSFYTICGGCPRTWSGFSVEAFSGLWEFAKLSTASGVMICLENWYYRILIVMTGNLANAKLAVDALSVWRTLQKPSLSSSGMSTKPRRSSIRDKRCLCNNALSKLVSSGISRNMRKNSVRTWLSFARLRAGHSAICLSCSFVWSSARCIASSSKSR